MWIEKTKSGKYKFVEEYIDDLTGKRKRVSVTYEKNTNSIKKQAQRDLIEKINEKQTNYTDITLFQLLDIELEQRNIKSSSKSRYKLIVNLIKRKIENVPISRIDNNYALYVNRTMRDSYNSLSYLSTFFRWCYKTQYIEKDYTPLIFQNKDKKNKKSNKTDDKKLYFERDELNDLFKNLEISNRYNTKVVRLLVEFLTLTGLRIGEALALEEGDINNSILSVNKTYVYKEISTPKSASSIRTIGINSRCNVILKELKFLKRVQGLESDYIFTNKEGNRLEYTLVKQILKGFGARPHMFRHTHASLLAEQGVPLEEIQRRLGHENDAITKKIYVHVTEKTRARELEKFKELKIL